MTKKIYNNNISEAAAALGRKGGKAKSEAKARAARENGSSAEDHANTATSHQQRFNEAKRICTNTDCSGTSPLRAFKERVYSINGVDCVEMDSQSTASGSILYFFALEEIERNEHGWYIKPLKQARYLWKSWLKNKPEIPMRDYSVGENEKPYQQNKD